MQPRSFLGHKFAIRLRADVYLMYKRSCIMLRTLRKKVEEARGRMFLSGDLRLRDGISCPYLIAWIPLRRSRADEIGLFLDSSNVHVRSGLVSSSLQVASVCLYVSQMHGGWGMGDERFYILQPRGLGDWTGVSSTALQNAVTMKKREQHSPEDPAI